MTVIVGHRGARNAEPENTLLSFRKGIGLGVDYVECDVRLTKDGELVAMHDSTLERTTNGTGEVEGKSLAELKELDAGKGEKIPTLQEIIDTVKGKVGLIVELKGSDTAAKSVELVKKNGLEKVIFVSFKKEELERVKEIDSSLAVAFISRDYTSGAVGAAKSLGARALILPTGEAGPEAVGAVHGEGLEVGVWTVNDSETYKKMLGAGVDIIVSDDPGALRV